MGLKATKISEFQRNASLLLRSLHIPFEIVPKPGFLLTPEEMDFNFYRTFALNYIFVISALCSTPTKDTVLLSIKQEPLPLAEIGLKPPAVTLVLAGAAFVEFKQAAMQELSTFVNTRSSPPHLHKNAREQLKVWNTAYHYNDAVKARLLRYLTAWANKELHPTP